MRRGTTATKLGERVLLSRDRSADWYGPDMHQLLCNAAVPEGLPHAGEYAMDANAQTLFAQEYKRQNEKPPAGSVRKAALAEAVKHLGLKESPGRVESMPLYRLV